MDEAAVERAVDRRFEQRLEQLELKLTRTFTTREWGTKVVNSVSGMQADLRGMETTLGELQQAFEQAEVLGNEDWQQTVTALSEQFRGFEDRLTKLEQDLNVNFEDIYQLRGEIRGVLVALDSYQTAYRAALEVRRDALLRELNVLDDVLKVQEESEPGGG